MVADDQIDRAAGRHLGCDPALPLRWCRPFLDAPVQADDHELGAETPRPRGRPRRCGAGRSTPTAIPHQVAVGCRCSHRCTTGGPRRRRRRRTPVARSPLASAPSRTVRCRPIRACRPCGRSLPSPDRARGCWRSSSGRSRPQPTRRRSRPAPRRPGRSTTLRPRARSGSRGGRPRGRPGRAPAASVRASAGSRSRNRPALNAARRHSGLCTSVSPVNAIVIRRGGGTVVVLDVLVLRR